MFKLETAKEREAFKLLKGHKFADIMKDVLKRELNMHHKIMENEIDTNATNVYKGRCHAIRETYKLFNDDPKDGADNYVEPIAPVVKEVVKVKWYMKIINKLKHQPDTQNGPVK